jgi:uncharacterized SAM-binding protein YcdF (DUF218 family)
MTAPVEPKVKRVGLLRRFVCFSLILVLLLCVAGIIWPQTFLMVEQKPAKADAIVLLGGGMTFRVPRAQELFEQQLAPVILISGKGDAEEMQHWLINRGVPEAATQLESESKNTWQNATCSVRILRSMGVKRVILVTSWYHSRRALACFRKAGPEIEFISLPTQADLPGAGKEEKHERYRALYEYIKMGGYLIRYGVNPL